MASSEINLYITKMKSTQDKREGSELLFSFLNFVEC